MKKLKLIVLIFIWCKLLYRVVCVEENEVWVSGNNKVIICLDVYKIVKEIVIIICWWFINDILVIIWGDFIYSDYRNRMVNIVREGKIELLLIIFLGWYLCNLYVIKVGDVFVNMFWGLKNKIYCY